MTLTGALDLDSGSGDIRLGGNFSALSEARVGTGSGEGKGPDLEREHPDFQFVTAGAGRS